MLLDGGSGADPFPLFFPQTILGSNGNDVVNVIDANLVDWGSGRDHTSPIAVDIIINCEIDL